MSNQIDFYVIQGNASFKEFNFKEAKSYYNIALSIANRTPNPDPRTTNSNPEVRATNPRPNSDLRTPNSNLTTANSKPDSNPDPRTPDGNLIPLLVEIHRKIGLSNLFIRKWEKEGSDSDKLKLYNEAMQAFENSLVWSKRSRETHRENVQVTSLSLTLNDFTYNELTYLPYEYQ
jgi:hypothetical protein